MVMHDEMREKWKSEEILYSLVGISTFPKFPGCGCPNLYYMNIYIYICIFISLVYR